MHGKICSSIVHYIFNASHGLKALYVHQYLTKNVNGLGMVLHVHVFSTILYCPHFIYRGVMYFWGGNFIAPKVIWPGHLSKDPPLSKPYLLYTVWVTVRLLDSLGVCAGRVCGWSIWIDSSGSHSEQMCTWLVCIPHTISGKSVLIPVSQSYATVDGTVAKPQWESLQMKPANSILWLTGWKKFALSP